MIRFALHFLFGAIRFALAFLYIATVLSREWLWLLMAPPIRMARIRAIALLAQCRHRLSFKGGVFIQAVPA